MSLTGMRPFISSSRFISAEALSEHELTKGLLILHLALSATVATF